MVLPEVRWQVGSAMPTDNPSPPAVPTGCCVVGGPAGKLLGVLFIRARVTVQVLEKHPDFPRDFPGDTMQPSRSN